MRKNVAYGEVDGIHGRLFRPFRDLNALLKSVAFLLPGIESIAGNQQRLAWLY